jgi:hypothetical protein
LATSDLQHQSSTHWDLAVLAADIYDGGLSWSEEGLMIYDNEAVARYLYGGLARLRANVAVSQAAYLEARDRATRDRDILAAKAALAEVVKAQKGTTEGVELSVAGGRASPSARW